MRAFPIRLFHAFLFGLLLGTVLSITSLHMFPRLSAEEPGNPAPGNPPGENPPIPTPPPVLNPTPDDLDGDGMPNTWETQYHHNPQDASDAGADFDNDGLTTLAEYQLYQQTSGVAGNPLGKWKSETFAVPQEFTGGCFYPADINRHGDVLVNADIYPEGNWRCAAFIVSADGVWTEIVNQNEPAGGYLWANDFNDQREVVGAWYSEDWSEYQSYKWDPVAGFRPFTFQGGRAESYKINNYGDWLGSVENPVTGEWTPVFVVDGINQHAPGDWWTYLWYTDLNDYGEAMGSYYYPQTGRYNTFLAHGGWSFDTGLLGNLPVFDQSTYSYSWSSAMNACGEFTGGAGGYQNNQWSYMGYHFDGEFNEISLGGRDVHYLSPESLNSANTIVGYAGDSSGHYGAFIYSDGVGLFLDELLPGSDVAYSSRINEMGQIVAVSQDYQRIFLVSPDQDQDGDGMPDDWEQYYGFNPSVNDSNADADGDGTNNLGEFLLRTDPNAAPIQGQNGETIDTRPGIDTDGDGMPNVWECANGLNYDDPSDAPLDFDRDGYTNLQEFRLNTDPRGAPSYRIREVGPFSGASSVSLSSAVLGDGAASASYAGQIGANVTESVFFPAKPTAAADGGQRPAAWSILRSASGGSLSFTPSHGSQNTYPVAQAPGGASLCYFSGSPTQFVYWASSSSAPVTLSGVSSANDISYLYNAKLSPSGNFLVATRAVASASGVYQPVIWKMPLSATAIVKPIRLIPPAGVTLSDWAAMHVNDYGHVVATGTIGGQNRPILWTINETGTAVSSAILPPLPGGIWASVYGISNQSSPLICGTSTITGGQSRATVWNASGIATNLGTLPGGSYSTATVVSRGGKIAGLSNVLVGNTLKYQPFLASYDPASATWKLQAQGAPGSYPPSLQLVNDSGEILGRINEYTPAYRQVSYLWRHGRAYPLDTLIPASSGHTLDTIKSINPNGTLLATTWKDGAQMTVLLTPDSDTDGDGLPDAFENQYAFNAFVKNCPATDSDSDGLTDLDEYRNGTQPRNPDTDNDGMKDGWEVSWGLLPLDPSDAALDPDGDHVTNLRESQIGTTPTGIYKVETRLTDTDWTYPSVLSADDSGQIIHTGQYQYGYETDESGFQVESYSQDHLALARADMEGVSQPLPLPPASSLTRYNSDWTEYSYTNNTPAFWPDAASGLVHGAMNRSSGCNDAYGSWWEETLFLIPDAANSTDESSWIPWETIETNLRGTTIDNSYTDEEGNYIEDIQTIPGVIDEADTIYPNADAVSPSGTRRIHRTAMGQCLVLNESGGFIESLPASTYWQKIDDQGRAIALTTRRIAAANGSPAYYAPELKFMSYGYLETFPIPHEPGVATSYSLQRFSNDGRILLSRSVRTAQLASIVQNYVFDINTRSLTRVRQPGLGSESVISLSTENGRMVGSGPKPFQITPDGTCIRLDAMRIKNGPTDTPTPFGTLYPRPLSPNHIASDGRITVSTNNNGQTVILQIVPCNDADNDGVPDDWEMDFRDQVAGIFGPNDGPADAAFYDVNQDYGNIGMTAGEYYNHWLENSLGLSDHALFGMNTLYPSSWMDCGYMYYLDKKTVKFHSFVQGASCEGYGICHSSDELDTNGYKKMTHKLTDDTTSEDSTKKTVMKSEELTTAEVDGFRDFLQNSWPTDFPEYKRFWDAEFTIKLTSTETTDYKLAANAPARAIKKKVVTSDPAEQSWHPIISVSHNQTDEEPTPTIPTSIVTTRKDDETTTVESSILPSVSPLDVWTLQMLDYLDTSDSTTEWSMDFGDGTTEEYKVSTPVAWRGLSNNAYDFAKSNAKSNYFATNRTTIYGNKGDYGEFGSYQKSTWSVEGPEDNDHTLMIVKTYSKTDTDGVYKTEKKYKFIPLKSNETISITEEADPGDDWESVEVELDLLPVEVVPDYTRDGKIDQADRGKVTADNPWRWWVNDDNDYISPSGDIPGSTMPDHANSVVNGMRDLIDFFSIHLDIESVLSILPKDQYQYYIKNSDQGFKYFEFPAGEPDPPSDRLSYAPNSHITDVVQGNAFAHHELNPAFSTGFCELSNSYLAQAENGKGLLLLEATKETSSPVEVEIRKGAEIIGTVFSFPVRISKVEKMFRHVDLTQIPKNYDGSSPGATRAPNGTKTADPGDPYPDTLTNGKYYVFMHGFNVPVQAARGWNAEIFKRMHQMGSKARFVGTTWTGATGVPLVYTNIGSAEKSSDYHKAVFFALQTGRELNEKLAFTNGADLTVAAHSLGNMVVSEAIENGGLNPSRYYIINGAVAREAYDETSVTTGENTAMTEHDWKPYGGGGGDRLYAAKWYILFGNGDNRRKLTWKNRFAKATISESVHNFYSPGDEVVQNPERDSALGGIFAEGFARGAWANQELMKGTGLATHSQSRAQGGWGFNFNSNQLEENRGYCKTSDGIHFRKYLPDETYEITNEQLKSKPFFTPFLEAKLFGAASGSVEAGETKVRDDVLARGIPSMSYAIAVNPVPSLAGNYDMEAMKTWPDSWPTQNHDGRSEGRWLHSDFRDVAINYLRTMYSKMIDLGELNKN